MERLPLAVTVVFAAWVGTHYPDRANEVLNQVRDMRGRVLNDARVGHRTEAQEPVADMVCDVFPTACVRARLTARPPQSNVSHVRHVTGQRSLFDGDAP